MPLIEALQTAAPFSLSCSPVSAMTRDVGDLGDFKKALPPPAPFVFA